MKFLCACGNVIRDQTDNLPFKAQVLPDESEGAAWDAFAKAAAGYVDAAVAGDDALAEWFKARSVPDTAEARSHESAVYELASIIDRNCVYAYECSACGRLYIERERGALASRFVSFRPESGVPEGVLRKRT